MMLRKGGWNPVFAGQQYYLRLNSVNEFPPCALITDQTFRLDLGGE